MLDTRVDHALTGLRDGAEVIIRGAGDDEKDLIEQVENFLNEILPNGVATVTSKSFVEEITPARATKATNRAQMAALRPQSRTI